MSSATPAQFAAAWRAFRGDRKGTLLGPGPAFAEAINAALAVEEAERAAASTERWAAYEAAQLDHEIAAVEHMRGGSPSVLDAARAALDAAVREVAGLSSGDGAEAAAGAPSREAERMINVPAERRVVLPCTVTLPTPDMIRIRLLRDGWTERPARHPGASIFELAVDGFDDPFSLALPCGESIGREWRSSIDGALRTLAGLERRADENALDRPIGDLAAEIIAAAARSDAG